jgi:hypothetical protein
MGALFTSVKTTRKKISASPIVAFDPLDEAYAAISIRLAESLTSTPDNAKGAGQ